MVRSETSSTGCGVTGHAAGFETSRLQSILTWSTTNSSPSWPGAVMPLSGAVTAVVTGVRFTRAGPGTMGAGTGLPTGSWRTGAGDPRSAAAGAGGQSGRGTAGGAPPTTPGARPGGGGG